MTIGLTRKGHDLAAELSAMPEFRDIAMRAKLLKAHLDLTATNLMKFVYETFPELSSLSMNEVIGT